VPATNTKNRKARSIALTPQLEEIIKVRKRARVPGCDFIFHNERHAIKDYRKCWQTVCVMIGIGKFYCRDCRDEARNFTAVLDAKKTCPKCAKKWEVPKYVGKLFHDFRGTAAHELWKAGNSEKDCMEVTGHSTVAMFERYADLFSEEEKQARQRAVQERRQVWREAQLENLRAMPTTAFRR
jgi:integrase